MTVQLEVGMTAIRRDGMREVSVRPWSHPIYPFAVGSKIYTASGKYLASESSEHYLDIIAAGYPWAELGAQMGDTVRRVWRGWCNEPDDYKFTVSGVEDSHKNSLYVIVKRAAKAANRPRAAHKLGLRDGDVVELVGRQDGQNHDIGSKWKLSGEKLLRVGGLGFIIVPSILPKGKRPLFRVISRAAEQKSDEVIEKYGYKDGDYWMFALATSPHKTHRFTLTFPAGSDVGTVTREKL